MLLRFDGGVEAHWLPIDDDRRSAHPLHPHGLDAVAWAGEVVDGPHAAAAAGGTGCCRSRSARSRWSRAI